jgi:Tyrosine-protein kinase ephrin type A/B receptor-like
MSFSKQIFIIAFVLTTSFCTAQQPAQPACPAGTYSATVSATAATTCTQCAAGTYSAIAGAACTNCAAGTYSATVGATAATNCTQCAAGKSSIAGATACGCAAGTYLTNDGCTGCALGTYSVVIGSSSCLITTCPAGQVYIQPSIAFNQNTSTAGCVACPPGQWSSGGGILITCQNTTCPVNNGYTAALPNNASSNITGCAQCPSGTVSAGGISTCVPCTTGQKYVAAAGTIVALCVDCPENTWSLGGNTTNCTSIKCNAGTGYKAPTLTSARNSSTAGCVNCTSGKWSDGNGFVCNATNCPDGSGYTIPPVIMDRANETAGCAACMINGTWSKGGISGCTVCSTGQFYVSREAKTASSKNITAGCINCPDGQWSRGNLTECLNTGCKVSTTLRRLINSGRDVK